MIAKQPRAPARPATHHQLQHPGLLDAGAALAVFELLDDLRDQIGAHYSVQLLELSREQHLLARTDDAHTKVADQSF